MKRILVLGAGRTLPSLINYLATRASEMNWEVRVADLSLKHALQKIEKYSNASACAFDIQHTERREKEIAAADLVISLLPVRFHIMAAKTCLKFKKHLLTASYVSDEMKAMDQQAKKNGVLLLNECGLDPGIDHMTAMAALDKIREEKGGRIDSFISYTGGLISPETDNNPWNYKFTWNPRNVVLAGKETAQFIRNGRYKYIPYHRVFTRLEPVHIAGYGDFEGYANRDSLKYRDLYGLQNVETILRSTLRRPGFCEAWNVFVQLGITDDSYTLEKLNEMTYRDFINTFLYFHPTKSVEDKLCKYLKLDRHGEIMQKLIWLGIFEKTLIEMDKASPAKVLQGLLEQKWKLEPNDRDMIVMQHQIGYSIDNHHMEFKTSLVVIGDDIQYTAMSKTVGWPLAIAAKMILTGGINDTGVKVPVTPRYYQPIIKELETLGVKFIE
ncbi:MAG: saccharopine dehydrogenase [Bacteroidetes bacterium]|nr:MAG: saccharopine dehydrogenase [Bacteroidota bacterium]